MVNGPDVHKGFYSEERKRKPQWPVWDSTEEKFRQFVARKYGFVEKGLLGYELNRAMREYVRKHSRSMGPRMENPPARTHVKVDKTSQQYALELRDRIVMYLIEKCNFEPQPKIRVGLATLKAAICAVEGIRDYRAIKSRLTLLDSSRLISQYDWVALNYEITCNSTSNDFPQTNGHMAGPPRGVTG